MEVCILPAIGAVVAILSAPVAGAEPDETRCGKRGGASMCQKPGHSSLHSQPPGFDRVRPGSGLFRPGWMPGYGRIQLFPVIG